METPGTPSTPAENAGSPAVPATTEAAPAAPQATAEPAPHAMYEIRDLVKSSLSTVGNEVKDIIVAGLRKDEVAKRAEATTKVMGKIQTLESDLKKIKPKHLGVTLKGEPAGEPVYQPEDAKKHKETSEKLAKLHGAFNRAIREHNFDKLFELAGQGD